MRNIAILCAVATVNTLRNTTPSRNSVSNCFRCCFDLVVRVIRFAKRDPFNSGYFAINKAS